MGTTLNKETYEKLIAADLDALSELPHSLEKDHIRSVLNDSVDFYYQLRESQKADTRESNCTIFGVRASALIKAFAKWNNKYPKGRIYSINSKDGMEMIRELDELADEAQELSKHLP
jgi:hypothetical protein